MKSDQRCGEKEVHVSAVQEGGWFDGVEWRCVKAQLGE